MVELLLMMLRGIVIGVVVSAPMGPVGIYCIQRTLDKGRLSGLYTGVGAAISDFIYCLLTGFGLSFIEDFINNHRSPIQLVGSVVLIFFGIWLMRKKPDGQIEADADHGAPSREGDILKGFALTFSNPLILFLIIGLFAQFNFVIEGMKFYHYLLGFLGIIGGALGWWWMVTHFVDKLHGHFTQRTMKLINTMIGIIILIFAGVGIFSSATDLLASDVVPGARRQRVGCVEFRVADTAMKGWRMRFACEGGRSLSIAVRPESQSDPFGDSSVDVLSVKAVDDSSGLVLGEAVVSQGIDPYRGKNAWRMIHSGDRWNVFAGNREYGHVMSFSSSMIPVGKPMLISDDVSGIAVSAMAVTPAPDEDSLLPEADVFFALESSRIGSKGPAGVYSMLDYEQDDSFARLGGSYRLAVVARQEGGYDVYYMGGARENATMWAACRLKAKLNATPFPNLYDVEWCDAEGGWMRHDVQAEFDALAHTLTVKFPYQGSSIRFRKE